MSLEAGTALRDTGAGNTGAPGKSDLTGVNSTAWALNILWRILKKKKHSSELLVLQYYYTVVHQPFECGLEV